MSRVPGQAGARGLRASSERDPGLEAGAASWGRDPAVEEVTRGTGARECPNNCSNDTLRCHLGQPVPGQADNQMKNNKKITSPRSKKKAANLIITQRSLTALIAPFSSVTCVERTQCGTAAPL